MAEVTIVGPSIALNKFNLWAKVQQHCLYTIGHRKNQPLHRPPHNWLLVKNRPLKTYAIKKRTKTLQIINKINYWKEI